MINEVPLQSDEFKNQNNTAPIVLAGDKVLHNLEDVLVDTDDEVDDTNIPKLDD